MIKSKTGDVNLCDKPSEFICKEDAAKDLVRISKSSRETFARCRQAYYFGKVCHIRVKDQFKSNALKMGTVFDEFIPFAYSKRSFKDRFEELVDENKLDPYDVARLKAIFRSYHMLGLVNDDGGEFQSKFEFVSGKAVINGVIDVKYTDYFEEVKFSGSPDWYTNPYNVAHQLATYFLSDNNLKRAVMKIVRRPGQKIGKDETSEAFEERILGDILSRPSHYYLGFNRASASFGINYYRDEFEPLRSVIEDYEIVTADILHATEMGWWYQDKTNCYRFGAENACEYLDICSKNGRVDEERYNIGGGK